MGCASMPPRLADLTLSLPLQSGEIEIINHKTGDKCNLKFVPYSYFSRDVARKVKGPSSRPIQWQGADVRGWRGIVAQGLEK